jgi:hypothetical protein
MVYRGLFCVYFNSVNGVPVVVTGLPDGLVRNPHELGTIIERQRRRKEDEREDHDADHVILDGPSLKGPHEKTLHTLRPMDRNGFSGAAGRLHYGKRCLRPIALSVPRKGIVIADDDSVAHFNKPICKGNQFWIVCDQNNGLLEPAI